MTEVTEARGTVSRPPVCLVNLTEHEIALESEQQAPGDQGHGLAPPSVLRVSPAGQFARVDDDQARLSEGWLLAAGGRVRLARLRRSRRLMDLPPAVPGTRYVVSRLTAHAARHRGDLVFPLAQVRDGRGQIIGAGGLGTYRRSMAVAERYRDWRAAAAERRSRRSLPSDWVTAVLFAAGTALLSGGLGLVPGVLDNASANGWAGGHEGWTSWLTVAFFVAGAVALGAAARRWLTRQRMLGERGTAYVIDEQADWWLHEEKTSALAAITAGFASVLLVPGPEALGENWHWQADAGGAPQWDARTDQLVRSFWAVHYNDDHVTRNALFVWAPWPVAMAFGARATARRRGLVLHVRQRPSDGAAGRRDELRLEDSAHDFLAGRGPSRLADIAPQHALAKTSALVTIRIQPLPGHAATSPERVRRPAGSARLPARSADSAGDDAAAILLLLVRFGEQDIGAIPADVRQAGEIALQVSGSLAGSVLAPGPHHEVPVAEWRLSAADGSEVPWRAFPAVAECIAGWVEEQAFAHPGHVVLVASRMPQEVAVGLGIELGRRPATWPRRVYPVHYASGQLVVPDLDLGRDCARGERR
jgi:hypothetical protein